MPPAPRDADDCGASPTARRAAVVLRRRRVLAGGAATIFLVLLTAGPACSEGSRYRVLSFFLDGVPVPGATPPPAGYTPAIETARRPFLVNEQHAAPTAIAYAHEPYRAGDCTSCHDRTSGELVQTVQAGLCQSCHADVPGRVTYVHGPVAVRDCLFCHNAHGSGFEHVLVAEPTQLCLRCHDAGDLTTGAHHADVKEHVCGECHSAHGGADPFFLKRTER